MEYRASIYSSLNTVPGTGQAGSLLSVPFFLAVFDDLSFAQSLSLHNCLADLCRFCTRCLHGGRGVGINQSVHRNAMMRQRVCVLAMNGKQFHPESHRLSTDGRP